MKNTIKGVLVKQKLKQKDKQRSE